MQTPFIYREASPNDIPQIQLVRNAVTENVLSDPTKVTDEDCRAYMEDRGKGWVCAAGDLVTGFAIADLQDENIWALFVHPEWEGKGIGSRLHRLMLDWYFTHRTSAWLSTGVNTRAVTFYRLKGWQEVGPYGSNEIKFMMEEETWKNLNATPNGNQ